MILSKSVAKNRILAYNILMLNELFIETKNEIRGC